MSFKVHKNEFYAIVGGNGVGKSTALSVISKINKPYRGKVFINDDTKVAVMPQNPQSLFLKKSVLEELYDAVFDVEKEKRKNDCVSSLFCLWNYSSIGELKTDLCFCADGFSDSSPFFW